MEIRDWALEKIKPYERNARKIPKAAVLKVAKSIETFGFRQPIVVDKKGVIVVGHVRLMAAIHLKLKKAPVHQANDLTDQQIKLYRLADNRTHDESTWDLDILGLEFGELQGADLSLAGFDQAEIASAFAPLQPRAPSASKGDALVKKFKVQAGQVWICGDHRVMCGDCTSKRDVATLLGKDSNLELVFTSPPYQQQRQYVAGKRTGDWTALMRGMVSAVELPQPAQMLVNLGLIYRESQWIEYWSEWMDWMLEHGYRKFGWYVWDQLTGLPGDWSGRLAPAFEFLFHLNRSTKKANKTKVSKSAGRKWNSALRNADGKINITTAKRVQPRKVPDSVIRVPRHNLRGALDTQHPAMFPIEFAAEILQAFSPNGGAVYDPFAGSGSTMLAGQSHQRKVFSMEIEPKYCAVALARMEEQGIKPERDR